MYFSQRPRGTLQPTKDSYSMNTVGTVSKGFPKRRGHLHLLPSLPPRLRRVYRNLTFYLHHLHYSTPKAEKISVPRAWLSPYPDFTLKTQAVFSPETATPTIHYTGSHCIVNQVITTTALLLVMAVWPFTYWAWLETTWSCPNFRASISHGTQHPVEHS
jgi:hypothetical protein